MRYTGLAALLLLLAISPVRAAVVDGLDSRTVTIENGENMSEAVGFGSMRLVGIEMPDAWTAANLTFQVSTDGGQTWKNKYDPDNTEYEIVTGASRYVDVDEYGFDSVTRVRVRSGTAALPVNQLAERDIKLIIKPDY